MEAGPSVAPRLPCPRRSRNQQLLLHVPYPSYDAPSVSAEEALARIRCAKRYRDQFCPLMSPECSKKRRLSRITYRRQKRLVDGGLAACVASSTSRDLVPRHYCAALKILILVDFTWGDLNTTVGIAVHYFGIKKGLHLILLLLGEGLYTICAVKVERFVCLHSNSHLSFYMTC